MTWLFCRLRQPYESRQTCRGEPVGEYGGFQVMSNPLILHGAKVPLPRPRPTPMRPLPILLEDPSAAPVPQQADASGPKSSPVNGSSSSQPPSAMHWSSATQASGHASQVQPNRSVAANAAGNAQVKGKQASMDQLQLKLRMQSTIQAYTSSPVAAARNRRNNLVTTTLPGALYRRTNSSPVRAPRFAGRTMSEARRGSNECSSSSCHSSSPCSSAAANGVEGSPRLTAGVGVDEEERDAASRDRSLLQTKSLMTSRGIPQVRCCLAVIASMSAILACERAFSHIKMVRK